MAENPNKGHRQRVKSRALARCYQQDKLKAKAVLGNISVAGEYDRTLFTGRLNEAFYSDQFGPLEPC